MDDIQLLKSSDPRLNAGLGGGLPLYSCSMVAGKPGTGKTILCQQLLFDHVRQHAGRKVLYVTTLSEPMPKAVHYMQQSSFSDAELLGQQVVYQDIGLLLRDVPLKGASDVIMDLLAKHDRKFERTLDDVHAGSLLNAYDVVLELSQRTNGARTTAADAPWALPVLKARGAAADLRPYPYSISRSVGVQVQKPAETAHE